MYTWSSVHRVADCQPTQPDTVGEKLAVFTIISVDDGIPRRAGRKLVQIAASRGKKNGAVLATTCWTYCHSFCRQKVKPAYAV